MPGIKAILYNPVTCKTASSEVTEFEEPFTSLLHAAQTRAKTLRTLEPLADRSKCVLKVELPNGKTMELRKVMGREFWKESDDA